MSGSYSEDLEAITGICSKHAASTRSRRETPIQDKGPVLPYNCWYTPPASRLRLKHGDQLENLSEDSV